MLKHVGPTHRIVDSKRLGLCIIWLGLILLFVVLTAAEPAPMVQDGMSQRREHSESGPSTTALVALFGVLVTGGGIIWKGGALESMVRASIEAQKEQAEEYRKFKNVVEAWNADSRADRAGIRADVESTKKSVDRLNDDISDLKREMKR